MSRLVILKIFFQLTNTFEELFELGFLEYNNVYFYFHLC